MENLTETAAENIGRIAASLELQAAMLDSSDWIKRSLLAMAARYREAQLGELSRERENEN